MAILTQQLQQGNLFQFKGLKGYARAAWKWWARQGAKIGTAMDTTLAFVQWACKSDVSTGIEPTQLDVTQVL